MYASLLRASLGMIAVIVAGCSISAPKAPEPALRPEYIKHSVRSGESLSLPAAQPEPPVAETSQPPQFGSRNVTSEGALPDNAKPEDLPAQEPDDLERTFMEGIIRH